MQTSEDIRSPRIRYRDPSFGFRHTVHAPFVLKFRIELYIHKSKTLEHIALFINFLNHEWQISGAQFKGKVYEYD